DRERSTNTRCSDRGHCAPRRRNQPSSVERRWAVPRRGERINWANDRIATACSDAEDQQVKQTRQTGGRLSPCIYGSCAPPGLDATSICLSYVSDRAAARHRARSDWALLTPPDARSDRDLPR